MAKKGPCYHCGTQSTPLWRNGPPEKPVLCNACGSRYRLGKSLENYVPKTYHSMFKKGRKIPSTGKTQRGIWSCGSLPSKKKRSLVVYRELTAIERLQKELWRIKINNPSILSGIEENVLIYTNKTNPYASHNEIGLGIVVLPP